MLVRYRLLKDSARAPERMTAGAAGFDLYATEREVMDMGGRRLVRYRTGVAFEIPEGHAGLVFPRSSVCKKRLRLSNCVGVVDSDYRGEVTFVFDGEPGVSEGMYQPGDRVGQIVFVELPRAELEERLVLSATERGEGGYGSTGA